MVWVIRLSIIVHPIIWEGFGKQVSFSITGTARIPDLSATYNRPRRKMFREKSSLSLLRDQMVTVQDVVSELADNWPAFVYIVLMLGFSILFLRERRAEAKVLKELSRALEERIRI